MDEWCGYFAMFWYNFCCPTELFLLFMVIGELRTIMEDGRDEEGEYKMGGALDRLGYRSRGNTHTQSLGGVLVLSFFCF